MKILTNSDIAKIMGKATATIACEKCRTPHLLPPMRILGGRKVWLEEDVQEWLKNLPKTTLPLPETSDEPQKRKRGRPTKSQQV